MSEDLPMNMSYSSDENQPVTPGPDSTPLTELAHSVQEVSKKGKSKPDLRLSEYHPARHHLLPIQEVEAVHLPLEASDELNPHGPTHDELRALRDRLAIQSTVVLRVGKELMAAGAGAYMAKISMSRVARAVGLAEHHVQVTFAELSSTVYAHGTFRTEVTEQRAFGANSGRLANLRVFIAELHPHMTCEDINKRLDEILAMPPYYGWITNPLASGVACGCFCFLNKGGLIQCLTVFVAAWIGQIIRRQLLMRHVNHFCVWMICAALSTLVYIVIVNILLLAGLQGNLQDGVISSILYLVPGFPLVTSILDLTRMDFQAGISRMTYVALLTLSAGMSLWLVVMIFGWSTDPRHSWPVSGITLIVLQLICSFVAAYGFAMLFNSAPISCLYSASIGAVVNVLRLWIIAHGVLPQAVAGGAAIAIGLIAALVSYMSHFSLSRVSLTVPAVVIMIPGVLFYNALVHMNEGNLSASSGNFLQAMFIVFSIGAGMALARLITDKNWFIDRDTTKPVDFNHIGHMR